MLGLSVTAIGGILSGLVSGVFPELVSEFKLSREDARKDRELQRELDRKRQLNGFETDKVRVESASRETVARLEAQAEELRTIASTVNAAIAAGSKLTGNTYIDLFNAALRPLWGVLFMVTFIAWVFGLLPGAPAAAASSLLAELLVGYMTWLFGYRSALRLAVGPVEVLKKGA